VRTCLRTNSFLSTMSTRIEDKLFPANACPPFPRIDLATTGVMLCDGGVKLPQTKCCENSRALYSAEQYPFNCTEP
jgi:hypothetical protein